MCAGSALVFESHDIPKEKQLKTTMMNTNMMNSAPTDMIRVRANAPVAIAALLLALGAPAFANHHEHGHDANAAAHDAHEAHGAPADAVADEFVQAEIRSIDRDNGKLMLKHEAIRKFNMNAMTMGFRADPRLLEALAVGDKVRFMPDRVNGQFVITKIEKLQ